MVEQFDSCLHNHARRTCWCCTYNWWISIPCLSGTPAWQGPMPLTCPGGNSSDLLGHQKLTNEGCNLGCCWWNVLQGYLNDDDDDGFATPITWKKSLFFFAARCHCRRWSSKHKLNSCPVRFSGLFFPCQVGQDGSLLQGSWQKQMKWFLCLLWVCKSTWGALIIAAAAAWETVRWLWLLVWIIRRIFLNLTKIWNSSST